MKVKPVHSIEDDCYRVYIISEGLRQQVGSDFFYTKENQEEKWISCLNYAKEIEDQLEYYKEKD
tara:strand:+ start:2568 stop:2759 length:192 start_codon:yes stop_codon:yes gene_type:complete